MRIFLRWPGWPPRLIDPHHCGLAWGCTAGSHKNQRRLRLRWWHASLSPGTRPGVTNWHASSPFHSPHCHGYTANPCRQCRSMQMNRPYSCDDDSSPGPNTVRIPMTCQSLRYGWGLRQGMRITFRREAHPFPHYQGPNAKMA